MSAVEPITHQALLREARSLMSSGRMADALPLFRALVEADSGHVEARNALAVSALLSGDLSHARAQLDAALAAAPHDALTLSHLAQLQKTEGDLPGALQTYAALLARQPDLYTVRLAYTQLLEATGDISLAAQHGFRALRQAQRAGRWLSVDSTPPGLRAQVMRTMALVDTHRRELCERLFAPLVQRFGQAAMQRVAAFVSVQLGEAAYTPPDARQRPTAMPFPGLPQSPYLDKNAVAGIAELESQTPGILAELQAVLGYVDGREAVFSDPALAEAFLRGNRGPASWDGYYFYRHGQRNETNATRCQQTMAAIDRLALARVRGHGPEVLFSTLGPGTHLLPHHGVTNARVVCHLPLIVPPDCALRVADEEHSWRVGEVVVFDDTYAHEAWNRSDQFRVVMIFDMWHPDLSEAERVAVCALQEALGDFAGPSAHGEA